MKYLCLNKIWKINEDYNIVKLLYLMIDRPNEIYNNIMTGYDDSFLWKNGKRRWHRDYDLPSNVYCYDNNNNNQETCVSLNWCINGGFHREKAKPAIITHDGHKVYHFTQKE